jgi:hypothetical protein
MQTRYTRPHGRLEELARFSGDPAARTRLYLSPEEGVRFPVTLTGSRAIVPAPSTPPPWNIEQGPVLESEKLPVGVVTAINGPAGSPSP